MEKEFVTHNQALALKELGFDEPCFAFYQKEYTEETPVMIDDDYQYRLTGWRTCKNSEIPEHYVSAPLKQQVFRWFREKYDLHHEIEFNEDEYLAYVNGLTATIFKTYEEAESDCIDGLIEIASSRRVS